MAALDPATTHLIFAPSRLTEQSNSLVRNGWAGWHDVRVNVDIRPCSAEDMAILRRGDVPLLDMLHHEERWANQLRQEAVYLLAWKGSEVVGRVTLFFQSKYPQVRSLLAGAAEMNALEARSQGRGIGTALILAGEEEARRRGAAVLGLAVGLGNHGARRLYERLGYVLWEHGLVVDRWTERDRYGRAVSEHADECFYLTKHDLLGSPPGDEQ
jgi:GNAT superfamily N-acetyltransferase